MRIIATSLDTIILVEEGALLRFDFLSFAFFSYMLQTTPKSSDEKNVKVKLERECSFDEGIVRLYKVFQM